MKTILCYGDSNTHGFIPASVQGRFAPDVRWTGQLAAALGPDVRIIEEGLGGRTTVWNDPIEGFKSGRDYLIPCLESHRPIDIVVLMLGTNDLKIRFGLSAADIADGCGTLIQIIQSQTPFIQSTVPRILLVSPMVVSSSISDGPFGGIFDGPSCEARSRQFPAQYKRIAQRYRTEFLDAAQYAEVSPLDGLHLDENGHTQLGRALAQKLQDMLAD